MNTEFIASAHPHHLPFVINSVLAAEAVPLGMSMYEAVFGISAEELRDFLAETLAYDARERPLSLGSFRMFAAGDEPVACCASWVEPRDGTASGAWVAMALSRFLGIDRFRSRGREIRLLSEVAPKRSPGALQLESFFVLPEYRGQRLSQRLITECLKNAPLGTEKAEISLLAENSAALAAYASAGFIENWRSEAKAEAFEELTGSRGFVQLSRTIER